jgi:hypothetical protein
VFPQANELEEKQMKLIFIFLTNIFRIFKKKRKKKRKSTLQQKLDRMEVKRRKYLESVFEEMTSKDPELKRLVIAKTFGFDLPDPSVGQRQEFDALINDLALQEIKRDPDLAQKIVSAKIFQTMQGAGLAPSNEELRNRPTPMQKMTKDFEELQKIREALGIKEPGLLEKILNSDVVASVLPIVVQMLLKGNASGNQEGRVVQVKKGEEKKIPLSEYNRTRNEQLIQSTGKPEIDIDKNKNSDADAIQDLPGQDKPDSQDQTDDSTDS